MQADSLFRNAIARPGSPTAKPGARVAMAARSDVLVLHRFAPFLGAPDSSPFVIKAMMLLKLAGIPYREVQGNPLKAPRKLLPYIEDDGVTVADSGLIRLHVERKYGFDFDAGLDPSKKAVAWAVERMCEDHLYFAMLEARWLDRAAFRKGVGKMFGVVPLPLRPFAKVMLRRANAARLYGHGLGRLTKSDIARLAVRDIDALAAIMGDRPYLLGDKPCGSDAFVFGIVTSILTPPLDNALRDAMRKHPNLVAYCDRLTRQFFPIAGGAG
jgi:glutathione S-transferase